MGSPWTVVNHPSVKCRHPAEVVCEVDPLCFIQLVNTIEGSNHEQRQSIRWVRDSIKHCLRVHFDESGMQWKFDPIADEIYAAVEQQIDTKTRRHTR